MVTIFDRIYPFLKAFFPKIEHNLVLADSKYKTPRDYIRFSSKRALINSVLLTVISGAGLFLYKQPLAYIIILFPVYFILMLYYMNMYLNVLVQKRKRDIDFEIIYMLRHIIVGAKSGMPLFAVLTDISGKYGEAGVEIGKAIKLTTMGKTLQQSLIDVAQKTPSTYLERTFIQLSNSLSSGTDISESLSSLLKQITDEEMIQLKSYGRRLTPFTMFYMIFGIIVPSIGIVLATVMFSIMGSSSMKFNGSALAMVIIILTIVQYLFLGMIKGGRPKYII